MTTRGTYPSASLEPFIIIEDRLEKKINDVKIFKICAKKFKERMFVLQRRKLQVKKEL